MDTVILGLNGRENLVKHAIDFGAKGRNIVLFFGYIQRQSSNLEGVRRDI